ncbi:MAG: hypothetical protein HY547_05800 [Elusimicrobia bacterium]|nr:hypothetical protein [Elusimicrobiota bacterium]
MVTHKVTNRAKSALQQNREDLLAFWDLCRKTNTTPQMVNKYQALGVVQAPDNRQRGLRQLYDMGAFSEVIAANFLKQFFTLREVADLRKLEHALWDTWKSDAGRVMNRAGDKLCWKFFFVKELRFSFYKGWEKTAEGLRFQETIKRYNSFRVQLTERLNPLGAQISLQGWEDSLLKTALSGTLPMEER